MGVVWGAEGAQECQMLLKLVQGRPVSKRMLDLACISVLGSHSHHLRDIEHACERDRLTRERAAESLVTTSCTPRRRIARDEGPRRVPVIIPPAVPVACTDRDTQVRQ